MRRKSFRLPCRTISERNGRRSGHSPPPHPIAASLNNTRQNRRSSPRRTERCIASYDTSPRPTTAAPPRRTVPRLTAAPTIQHSRSFPLHRNAHRPAVPHGVAAMPHDRRCTTFRQPAGRNIPTLLTDRRNVLFETKSNPRYIIPKKWLPLPRQGFRSKLRLTGINRERRAIRRQYLLL